MRGLLASAFLIVVAALGLRADGLSVTTHQLLPGNDSHWLVEVRAAGDVASSVLDARGRLVAGPFAAKTFAVSGVSPWTAETPTCYRLVTERDGARTETVFGFTEQVVRGDRLFVNGTPVRLKLGPRELNGNTVASDAATADEAWTNGLYRVAPEHLAQLDVQQARELPGATRHAFQDWSVQATNYWGRLLVTNRSAFLDGSAVTLRWTLLLDGEPTRSGELPLLGLKPGRSMTLDMPPEAVAARTGDASASLRLTFLRAARVIAEDQIDLVASRALNTLAAAGRRWYSLFEPTVAYDETGAAVAGTVRRFTTDRACFTYAEDDIGGITYTRRGFFSDTPLLTRVLPWRRLPVGGAGPDLAYPPSAVDGVNGALSFTALAEAGGVEAAQRWTVYPDGTVCCRARLRAPTARAGERLGFVLALAQPVDRLEWFGRGPWSHGRHETEGAFLGRWTAEVAEAFAAEEVRGFRLGDLTVRTAGAPFAIRLDRRGFVDLFGEPDADGVVDLAFTLSVDDRDLTARAPEDDANLPPFPACVISSKESEKNE